MAKWLEPLGKYKQHKTCEACKKYLYSAFYTWHTHPALLGCYKRDPIIICTKCCKREAGDKYYKKNLI